MSDLGTLGGGGGGGRDWRSWRNSGSKLVNERLTGRFWRLFCRFVATPISSVNKRLESETRELKTDITDLEKKLHYLETTHKNSVDNIDQILKSGGRA